MAGSASHSAKDLYTLLGVDRNADARQVKKAYHRLALTLHPDKACQLEPDTPAEVHQRRFQTLQQAYDVLSDKDKRDIYDRTGSVEAAEGQDLGAMKGDFDELYAFYRRHYKKVDQSEIEAFEAQYRKSEEEKGNLLELYTKHKGNMENVYAYLMCSNEGDDDKRFIAIIDEAIARGEAKSFDKYEAWKASSNKRLKKLKKRREKEAKEAEQMLEEMQVRERVSKPAADDNDDGMGALALQIRNNANKRGGFLDALAAKYSQPKKKAGKTKGR